MDSQAEESRRKTCSGRGLKGKRGRERPERRPGASAPLAQLETGDGQTGGTEKTQSDLQGEEERPHGQAAEGGERGKEQQRWMQTIEGCAARDPLQDKHHIQVTETFAALAEMKTAKGPGGYQATVEMWQNLPILLNLKVAAFDRYLTVPRHVNQPDTCRKVLLAASRGNDCRKSGCRCYFSSKILSSTSGRIRWRHGGDCRSDMIRRQEEENETFCARSFLLDGALFWNSKR